MLQNHVIYATNCYKNRSFLTKKCTKYAVKTRQIQPPFHWHKNCLAMFLSTKEIIFQGIFLRGAWFFTAARRTGWATCPVQYFTFHRLYLSHFIQSITVKIFKNTRCKIFSMGCSVPMITRSFEG